MIAHPLPPLSRLRRCEDVKSKLSPVIETLRDLHGFVQLMLSAKYAVGNPLAAFDGKVAVQFHHRGPRRLRVRAVNLNLVIALGVQNRERKESQQDEGRDESLHIEF